MRWRQHCRFLLIWNSRSNREIQVAIAMRIAVGLGNGAGGIALQTLAEMDASINDLEA